MLTVYTKQGRTELPVEPVGGQGPDPLTLAHQTLHAEGNANWYTTSWFFNPNPTLGEGGGRGVNLAIIFLWFYIYKDRRKCVLHHVREKN